VQGSLSAWLTTRESSDLCQVMMQNVRRTAAPASSRVLLIVMTGVAGLAGLVALLLSVLGLFSPERGRE